MTGNIGKSNSRSIYDMNVRSNHITSIGAFVKLHSVEIDRREIIPRVCNPGVWFPIPLGVPVGSCVCFRDAYFIMVIRHLQPMVT